MRQVIYNKHDLSRGRGRAVAIRESSADSDSTTRVVKNFVYLVNREDAVPDQVPGPLIKVFKKIDTRKKTEGFILKVKGEIYVKQNRFIYKVRYCHSLHVRIVWKTHVLSPDKPAALA